MTLAPKILLAVAAALFVVGVGLVIVQPGSLGGDDEAARVDSTTTTSTTTSTSTTSTTLPGATTSTPTGGDGTGTGGTGSDGGTGTGGTGTDGGTGGDGTGGDGSGFGDPEPATPSDTADGLADTGGSSMILLGLLAGTAALALRRTT